MTIGGRRKTEREAQNAAGRRPPARTKGRGAVGNPHRPLRKLRTRPVDDGWWQDDDLPALPTTECDEVTRQVITRNQLARYPVRSLHQSLSWMRARLHLLLCPAEPRLARSVARARLRDTPVRQAECRRTACRGIRRPGYRPATIMLGANTDPYQPIERRRRITRSILEVLAACRHPLAITTKSALVCRDLDLLRDMAAAGLVAVGISLTTLDPALARIMEPRAAAPAKRLRAMEEPAPAPAFR